MYTNLILFLVAIFLFSVFGVPDTPRLPLYQSALLFVLLVFVYDRIAVKLFSRVSAQEAAGYFRTERQLSIMAVCFFGGIVYLCDPKYYLFLLPGKLSSSIPALVNFAGLLIFVLFLSIMWHRSGYCYGQVFGRKYSSATLIKANIKSNLPIVLPWVIISLLYDVVALLPFPGLQNIVASEWGDLLFFCVFLSFVVVFFPPLVRNLWGCKKLPEGGLKKHLETFCDSQNFKADFYLWPLFEGRVLTAGVMGIVPGLRYILVTPALLETMSETELEAIMAHEIGHVKKRHLLLYVLLLAGFSVLAGMLAEPFVYLLLSLEFFNRLIIFSGISAENVLTFVGGGLLLIFMVVYFRYIFGYFIRNFERQADLFSLAAIGNGEALISAFEKIAVLSGNIRDQPNWHHFGIGERINCLKKAEAEPVKIKSHNRKVRFSLLAFVAIMVLVVSSVRWIPTEDLANRYQEKYAEVVLMQKASQEPDRALWHRLIGDLMLNKKMEHKALDAYAEAYSLDPVNPEVMNNYAWLLLTSKDTSLRDPSTALTLARSAATLQPKGYILDTLATAYWANDLIEEAVRTEKQAVQADPSQRRFYQAQALKFSSQSYGDSLLEQENEQSVTNTNNKEQ